MRHKTVTGIKRIDLVGKWAKGTGEQFLPKLKSAGSKVTPVGRRKGK